MIARLKDTYRGLAPTALFTTKDTTYGIAYVPVNDLARQCARLAGVFDLNEEQRRIVEGMGFNFEVKQ